MAATSGSYAAEQSTETRIQKDAAQTVNTKKEKSAAAIKAAGQYESAFAKDEKADAAQTMKIKKEKSAAAIKAAEQYESAFLRDKGKAKAKADPRG